METEIEQTKAKLSKLDETSAEIDKILSQHGVDSIPQLRVNRDLAANIISTAPVKAWDIFRNFRGVAAAERSRLRTSLLPGELAKEPEYARQEETIQQEREAAKVQLKLCDDSLAKIEAFLAAAI